MEIIYQTVKMFDDDNLNGEKDILNEKIVFKKFKEAKISIDSWIMENIDSNNVLPTCKELYLSLNKYFNKSEFENIELFLQEKYYNILRFLI
jgi:hypothetical protein